MISRLRFFRPQVFIELPQRTAARNELAVANGTVAPGKDSLLPDRSFGIGMSVAHKPQFAVLYRTHAVEKQPVAVGKQEDIAAPGVPRKRSEKRRIPSADKKRSHAAARDGERERCAAVLFKILRKKLFQLLCGYCFFVSEIVFLFHTINIIQIL